MMSMQHYFALLCDLIPLDLYRWSLKLSFKGGLVLSKGQPRPSVAV